MRLQARVPDLQYNGKTYQPGDLFDAPEAEALELINNDDAAPFHLEDPATRKGQIARGGQPPSAVP